MTTLDNVLNAIDARAHTNRQPYKDGYRMNNPFDSSSDSMSFYIFDIRPDGEGASYKYFAGDEGGTLYELADKLGVAKAGSRQKIQSTKRAYKDIKEYAKSHAVSVDYLTRCKWVEVTHQGRPALQFKTSGGTRYRFLDESQPRYISQKGYTVCWYGLDDAIKKSTDAGLDYIVLCNGEISTLSAKEHGLPAFCKTSGESAIPQRLLSELLDKWDKTVYIALDCDDTGVKSSRQIKEQLSGRGVIIDLLLSDGGDLADFCLLNGDDSHSRLVELARQQTPSTEKTDVAHTSDVHRSDNVLNQVLDELNGRVHIQQISFKFPIPELRKFGGFAELCETGKVTLIAGGSGTGKTQLLETMNDKLNMSGISGLWFGAEWRADEMMWRRIQRWTTHLPDLTPVSYDDIRRHRLYIKDAQNGVLSDDSNGRALSERQWRSINEIQPFLQQFEGTTEYFNEGNTLSDTIDQMLIAIERERRNGRDLLYAIFDYVQLLKAISPDSSVNRHEHAFEVVKRFAIDANVHVFMTSQVNKQSQSEISAGASLSMESAHFIRGDKANLFLTLNRQFYKRGDDIIETPAFYLNIVKASLGGRPDGYTEPSLRIPMIMNHQELKFMTHIDWRELKVEPFINLKDNKWFVGDGFSY